MLLEQLPSHLHNKVRKLGDKKMLKIMDMMKVRMRFLHDIKNHAYFFEKPIYDTDLGNKFL